MVSLTLYFILSLSEIALQLQVLVSLLSPAVKLKSYSLRRQSLVCIPLSSHAARLPSVHYTSMDV